MSRNALARADLAPTPLASKARAAALNAEFTAATAQDVLAAAITREFPGRIALVSSFGTESAALLQLVAEVDPSTPVLFVETQMLFPETLAYQERLAEQLGLTDVRLIRPDSSDVAATDPDGALHQRDVDGCCHIRKVLPLERALAPFKAWITGRKRHQAATRAQLRLFETDARDRVKVNPLVDWSIGDVRRHIRTHGLPPHPLVSQGYPSIGCAPCTSKVFVGEDPRAGRWRGRDKTECGIHVQDGKVVRVRRERVAPMDRVAEPAGSPPKKGESSNADRH